MEEERSMKYSMIINGEDIESETERTFDVTNPGNGELIAQSARSQRAGH
jgi:acyl-CoA reductase-like NAD-dependent aldehyde dehydrogenase